MGISLNSFTPNTTIESSKVNTNFTNISNHIRPSFVFTVDEVLIVGTNKTPILIVPRAYTIEKIFAIVKTAPDGDDLKVDINKNDVSIWSSNPDNKITITDGATTDTVTQFDTTSLAEGDRLTLDVDQVGSNTGGETLTVVMKTN